MTEGTYLGLGEMKAELDYLRQKVKIQGQLIEELADPNPAAWAIENLANQISFLDKDYGGKSDT